MVESGPLKPDGSKRRVLVAGATGYLGKFVALEFIVTVGEVDPVGPARGKTTLRSYFEEPA
jgi:hypothetical protein